MLANSARRSGVVDPALNRMLSHSGGVALVTVIRARGSTPREAGAFMLVGSCESWGTIGGGQLEWDCMDEARRILKTPGFVVEKRIVLGGDSSQCCGGEILVRIESLDKQGVALLEEREQARFAQLPTLLLFGAGHVGRAVARVLAPLPLKLRWIDPREEEFGDQIPPEIDVVVSAQWDKELRAVASGAAVLVMTQSHALDSLIVAAALERGDFRYVGLIGSMTKRRRFEAGFRAIGIPEERIATLICPIGGRGIRDKRPEIIAALVAAEIVEKFIATTD